MATVILADETRLADLELNGDNFISEEELTEDMFENNLSPVIIDTEDGRTTHQHMALVQITHPDGRWWFVLRDITDAELREAKIRGDIDYIAMMTDVELEA